MSRKPIIEQEARAVGAAPEQMTNAQPRNGQSSVNFSEVITAAKILRGYLRLAQMFSIENNSNNDKSNNIVLLSQAIDHLGQFIKDTQEKKYANNIENQEQCEQRFSFVCFEVIQYCKAVGLDGNQYSKPLNLQETITPQRLLSTLEDSDVFINTKNKLQGKISEVLQNASSSLSRDEDTIIFEDLIKYEKISELEALKQAAQKKVNEWERKILRTTEKKEQKNELYEGRVKEYNKQINELKDQLYGVSEGQKITDSQEKRPIDDLDNLLDQILDENVDTAQTQKVDEDKISKEIQDALNSLDELENQPITANSTSQEDNTAIKERREAWFKEQLEEIENIGSTNDLQELEAMLASMEETREMYKDASDEIDTINQVQSKASSTEDLSPEIHALLDSLEVESKEEQAEEQIDTLSIATQKVEEIKSSESASPKDLEADAEALEPEPVQETKQDDVMDRRNDSGTSSTLTLDEFLKDELILAREQLNNPQEPVVPLSSDEQQKLDQLLSEDIPETPQPNISSQTDEQYKINTKFGPRDLGNAHKQEQKEALEQAIKKAEKGLETLGKIADKKFDKKTSEELAIASNKLINQLEEAKTKLAQLNNAQPKEVEKLEQTKGPQDQMATTDQQKNTQKQNARFGPKDLLAAVKAEEKIQKNTQEVKEAQPSVQHNEAKKEQIKAQLKEWQAQEAMKNAQENAKPNSSPPQQNHNKWVAIRDKSESSPQSISSTRSSVTDELKSRGVQFTGGLVNLSQKKQPSINPVQETTINHSRIQTTAEWEKNVGNSQKPNPAYQQQPKPMPIAARGFVAQRVEFLEKSTTTKAPDPQPEQSILPKSGS